MSSTATATMASPTPQDKETSLSLSRLPATTMSEDTKSTSRNHRYDAWLPYKVPNNATTAKTTTAKKHRQEARTRNPRLPLYRLLGASADESDAHLHVLSPPLMESLRAFLPLGCCEDNFWMKYSLLRDGASYETLLGHVHGSQRTMIAVETTDGEVFGGFTSSPWKLHPEGYFGSGEAFLWRLKRGRFISGPAPTIPDKNYITRTKMAESEIEVYPFTGFNRCVQFCSHDRLALGGGTWGPDECPYPGQPQGMGLRIGNDLKRGSSFTNSTFANPMLYRKLNGNTTHGRMGEFDIANLEVWTLTPFTTVHDAEMQESRRLFIEEQSTRTQ